MKSKELIIALVGAVVLVGALAAIAVGATGAYFQNIKAGHGHRRQLGSITVATSGGSNPNGTGGQNFTWAHMLPAVPTTRRPSPARTRAAPTMRTCTSSFSNASTLCYLELPGHLWFPSATSLTPPRPADLFDFS